MKRIVFLLCVCSDLDGTAQSLRGVESEKEELSSLTKMLQKSIEVRTKVRTNTFVRNQQE